MSTTFNVDEALSKLTLLHKIKLLSGLGWWHTEPISQPKEGLKIESVRMSDGPNGVRGTRFFNGVPSSCFPCSTGLGSSFDTSLASDVGKALADECKAKGCHILLGPTCNTQRSPLGGRGFESFSEDPHLNGHIAAEYINGLQSKKVAATIKHFAANDQEFERFSISSDASERALREIYMMPFQIALKHSNPWAFMTAYNRINGIHASENMWLLQDVLRKEWGYKGMVMSDWTGVYSTVEAIRAGLDLEMPGPTVMRGVAVQRALVGEKLFQEDVDACVRKVLEMVKIAYDSGIPFDKPEELLDTPEVRTLLRRACADATVLLKNEKNLLPLKPSGKIAIIGPNAKHAVISGGGSASLRPTYTVSPLEGILAATPNATVSYNVGTLSHQFLPTADPYLAAKGTKDPVTGGVAKGKLEFWNEEPAKGFTEGPAEITTAPVFVTHSSSANIFLADGIDDSKVNEICWLRFTSTLTPDEDGDWELGLVISGRGTMFLDGKPIIDLTNPTQGDAFFGIGTAEVRHVVPLQKGKEYNVDIRICNAEFIERGTPFSCRGGIRLGAIRNVDLDVAMNEAVDAAKAADVAVLVIGLNNDWESEGHDREHMDLPGRTNELVSKVLAANPNTVVVNQSGTPVAMPWADEAHTLVQAFYGGNEVGNGLADVLFGTVNPSAKLPLTFPKRLADNPSYPSFGNKPQAPGKILYNEGVFVGYRGFEIKDLAPLFAFGHGLSYTTFAYSNLSLTKTDAETYTATFTVTNTGAVAGREAAQVYITDVASSVPRPKKELKAFAKTALLAPGAAETLSVVLDKYAFSFWEERKATWIAEQGAFEVLVAASSTDVRLTGTIELEKTFTWKGL